MKAATLMLCIALTACTSSSGVIPDGPSSFRISYTGDTGFSNSNTLKEKVYQEASTFCAGQGEIVETVRIDSKQSQPYGGWPEATLLFNCVSREK